MPPSSIRRHFGILALVSSHLCATTSEGVPINVIKAPANSLVPDVALDKSGMWNCVPLSGAGVVWWWPLLFCVREVSFNVQVVAYYKLGPGFIEC
jgi:hypothetical protein